MRKVMMIIPVLTILADIAILFDIPVLREIIVFIFLSFIPGFALLRLFKLKEISLLDTVLFSVALSITFVMLLGLLINELYLYLGFSQPLSTIPLTVGISVFTLAAFLIEYRRDLSETLKQKTSSEGKLRNVFPLSIILILLPLISALGVLYLNVPLILISYAIIAALCVMCALSRRVVPENLFPFLIFSISIALVCQVPLTSKYIIGSDTNLEYYVFRLTQINGNWGFLNAQVNSLAALTYDSMLSITLLPAVYSALMHAQGEIVFKLFYSFIFCFIPLTMYRICEKQFGKLIGLFSALFFVFTVTAFYGVVPLSVDRQIVGELFLMLSVFLLINKTIPVTKRRLLLIIFGAALVLSHYSLAYIFLAIVAVVFIISKAKLKFDDTLNTVTVLFLFVITFTWYSLGPNSPLISLTNVFKLTFAELTSGVQSANALGSTASSSVLAVPQVFTAASWINLFLSGIANFFLIIGVLSIVLRPKEKGILEQYKIMTLVAAIILVASLIAPSIAQILNFTRFYGITLLVLSPCFVLGGQTILTTIGKAWTKTERRLKPQVVSKSKKMDIVLLLIAILLSAYFLSQVGFINSVTNGAIHSYSLDFNRMLTSNDVQVKINLYESYIPVQDVFSATWLSNHKVETTKVFADSLSESHVLWSYGLIPNELLLKLDNTTNPTQDSFIYLGSLNVLNGVMTTHSGSFNTSKISFLLDQNNLVYSNGNSKIWYVANARAGSQIGNTSEPSTVNKANLPSTTTTVLSSSSIAFGGSVTDTATVAPGGTGSVTFWVSSNGGSSWVQYDGETLSGGSATSASYTPFSSGTYYFRAVYSGDAQYAGSQSGDTAELLTVNKANLPSTTTTVLSSSSIAFGGSVTDTATVAPGGTGSVTFWVSSNGGSSWVQYDGETLSGGSATSASYTPFSSGTYYFRAVYSGDAQYAGSQSGDTAELLTVNKANLPSTTTTVLSSSSIAFGGSVTDTATVAPGGTGSVTFWVSSNGGSSWVQYDGETLSGGSATSASYTPFSSGTYYFRAVYSGDAQYAGSQSGDTAELLTVNKANLPSTTTTVLSSSSIAFGGSVTDTATVAPGGTGSVTFWVSSNGGSSWVQYDGETLSGGSATSASYTPFSSGTYYFRAVYSGDAQYAGSQSGDTAERLVVH